MDTKLAVQNAIWPYLLGVICFEASEQSEEGDEDKDRVAELYNTFESYLISWVDELKHHQINSFKNNLETHSKFITDLSLNKSTGKNSTTKTIGIIKCMMELVEHVKLDNFH